MSRLRALACLLLGLVVLAGCGSGGSGSVSSGSESTTEAAGSPAGSSKRSVTKSWTQVGQAPALTKGEEFSERKPSEIGDETPTASWPFFGRLPQRTHYLGGPIADLDPPFKVLWHINTHALI